MLTAASSLRYTRGYLLYSSLLLQVRGRGQPRPPVLLLDGGRPARLRVPKRLLHHQQHFPRLPQLGGKVRGEERDRQVRRLRHHPGPL